MKMYDLHTIYTPILSDFPYRIIHLFRSDIDERESDDIAFFFFITGLIFICPDEAIIALYSPKMKKHDLQTIHPPILSNFSYRIIRDRGKKFGKLPEFMSKTSKKLLEIIVNDKKKIVCT